ncbi:MAG: CapA family protein [Spirochaetes bacterium]|nr:CapA family protein [Spirochaetota bacterium]
MKTFRISVFFAFLLGLCLCVPACDTPGSGGEIIIPGPGSDDDTSSGDTGDDGNTGGGETDAIRLVFAGDTMMDRKVKKSVDNNADGDYRFLFEYTADYLSGADIAFTNLESVISDAGYAQVYFEIAFEADPASVDGLTCAGIDVVSVANNHAFDYTRTAFKDCLERLTAAGITYIGGGVFEEAYAPKVFDVKGTKIAYLAFTLTGNISESVMAVDEDDPDRAGVAWYYPEYADPAIQRARSMADIVVVSVHFGEEYETVQNEEQIEVAEHLVDQGATLVVGHHPHVVQPLASYGGGHIAYSLGNFIFDQSDETTHRGMVLEVTVRDKMIESAVDRYININDYYQPVME